MQYFSHFYAAIVIYFISAYVVNVTIFVFFFALHIQLFIELIKNWFKMFSFILTYVNYFWHSSLFFVNQNFNLIVLSSAWGNLFHNLYSVSLLVMNLVRSFFFLNMKYLNYTFTFGDILIGYGTLNQQIFFQHFKDAISLLPDLHHV